MKIKNLMSEPPITVQPDTSLVEAVNFMGKFNLTYLIIVDDGKLAGLLTEKSLILNDSYLHLKTLLNLMDKFEYYKKDSTAIKAGLQKLSKTIVSDYMETTPLTLGPDDDLEKAAQLMGDPKVNVIPIVDEDKKLLGQITLSDLTKLYGISIRTSSNDKETDKNIREFMNEFQKKFLLVSRFRTKTWMFTSLMFALVGFIVAFMLILRVSVK
jgi:CBS domain-containing protein